jgi:hypothetical protein
MPSPDASPRPVDSVLRRRLLFIRRWAVFAFVLCGLVGGGMVLGFWLCAVQSREDHLAEVDRLQETCRTALAALTVKTSKTADAVADAAASVAEVAAKADSAAEKADTAAQRAGNAAASAQATAKSAARTAATVQQPVIVPPGLVNREIREANRKLEKRP